jgi:hypothetical protein
MGRTFPHPLSGGGRGPGPASYAALAASPLSGELLVDFARAALQGEALGRDEVPDVLAVSFSGVDYVYHHFGPYSVEMQDALVKLDAQLSELLQAAEKAAGGRGNLLVALAGDHGGAAMPEEWARSGMPGARVAPARLQQGLLEALQGRFGPDLLVGLDETDVYLGARTREAAARVDSAEVRRAAARWLAQQPQVRLAVARDDLFHAADPGGFLPALQKGYFRGRSGDVLLVLQPFHVATGTQHGTNHGMPYTYDTQVPLVLYGAGVKKGHYRQEIDATDVAPTLSALLEMGMPALSEGQVRSEALNGK